MLLRYRNVCRTLDNKIQNRLIITTIWAKLKTGSLRVKEWWTSSYRTCDVGEHEPAWVSARRANFTHCAFYRLPEELILQILGNLDNATQGIAQQHLWTII